MVELSPIEALDLVNQNQNSTGFVLLDVRTPEEYAEGHIAGAKLLPLGSEFTAALTTLPKNNTYLVYCRTGTRSLDAATQMEKQGFSKVFALTGGIRAWEHRGMPVEK